MESKKNCPNCNKPLDDQALQGLCPDCLLKAGWPTATEGNDPASQGFALPSQEELAGLFPQLEIQALIGRGGMGAVFKARQLKLDRLVALKILPFKKKEVDPGFAERFTREARALAKLNHHNIVGVHDYGQVEGFHYFIMEYVDGLNLRQVQQAGALSPAEALGIIPQICAALQFAHNEGVVHRDIKPENVLLDQKGQIKIADFGLAKIMGTERSNFTLTEPNHVMGTPHYMAPEQVEHPSEVDHRADIYSLGVVFYELLTGELPLGKFAPPSRKVQVDVRLDEVVLRALEKEPQLRYQQASQVATEIKTIVNTPDATQGGTHAPAKTSMCYITTPEHLRTFTGRFLKIYQGKGQLSLDRDTLRFTSGWQVVTIPLASIQSLAQGHYPTTAKPEPLAYMELTFHEHGALRTLLLTPAEKAAKPARDTNRVVKEWLGVIKAAFEAHTGQALQVGRSDAADQRTTPGDVFKLILSVVLFSTLPLLLITLIVGQYLPKHMSESFVPFMLVFAPIFTLVFGTTFPFFLRWRRRRSGALTDAPSHRGHSEDHGHQENKAINEARRSSGGFDVWKLVKRLALLLVTSFLLLIAFMLVASVVFPRLHTLRFTARHYFSPIMEQTCVAADMAPGDIAFWDLDTNSLVQPPFTVAVPKDRHLYDFLSDGSLSKHPELRVWMEDAGIDLAFAWLPSIQGWYWQLMNLGAERLNTTLTERSFDTVRKEHLIENQTSALRVAGTIAGKKPVPLGRAHALCLKTDQGTPGVLEYKGRFYGKTAHVRFRYKLLKSRTEDNADLVKTDSAPEETATASPMEQDPVVDFNDSGFWREQISRHLEAVRSLEGEFVWDNQIFGEDGETPESHMRHRLSLTWDREHQWIDCASKGIDNNSSEARIVQGDLYAWQLGHNGAWVKVKPGNPMLNEFSFFGESRKNAYEHAFGIAQGILCSGLLHRMQQRGTLNLTDTALRHALDGQGQHELKNALPPSSVPQGPDGNPLTADLILLAQWEQGAFKLLKVGARYEEYHLDLLYEEFADHVLIAGIWVPQRAVHYSHKPLKPDGRGGLAEPKLFVKTVVTARALTVNQPMRSEAFDGFCPPVGAQVRDQITGESYWIQPNLEQIEAAGGKTRVAVRGRVYLDGRPAVGMMVWTTPPDDVDGARRSFIKTQTDERGAFELSGLVPGFEYRINADDSKTLVKISELGEDYTDLKIDLTSGLSVAGVVRDIQGKAIPDALVLFYPHRQTVKTDAQGRYQVKGLYADQQYEVEVAAWGYAPLDPGGESVVKDFAIEFAPNGDPLDYDVTLEPERVLHGRIIDRDGRPVNGVGIDARGPSVCITDRKDWHRSHSNEEGHFRIGNLGDRVYDVQVGDYAKVFHHPLESPLVLRVTDGSFMPCPGPGRALVDKVLLAQAEAFEKPYCKYFRLKEYRDASDKYTFGGGKLISQWLEQLIKSPDKAKQYELLARLGSVPAFHAHDYLEQILCGRVTPFPGGALPRFEANMLGWYDPGALPTSLINSEDPNIICLAMRALARSGFIAEHAPVLIDKLVHENEQLCAYAQVALAELTGVNLGPKKVAWQSWLSRHLEYRSELNGNSHFELFASMCDVFRKHALSMEATERLMAAWQGGGDGGVRFRAMISGDQAKAYHAFFSSVKVDGEEAVQSGPSVGYWLADMFADKGYRNQDLSVRFERECQLGEQTFEPDRRYTIPALFRDGYRGQWEIVDLRLDAIQ
jgi:serine/threonine protein kinase